MKFELVTSGLQFPEGPIAMNDGSIIVVEIRRQTLTRVWPDGRIEIIAELGGGPNGAAIGPDGMVYVCNNGGFKWRDRPDGITTTDGTPDYYTSGSIQRVDPNSGKFDTIYDSCDGKPLRGPNDIVFDRDGGFWFTDLGKTNDDYRHHGAMYYARTDGSKIVRAKEKMITPNGCGLSPDGKTLYVAESMTGRLWALDIVGEGELKEPETMVPGRLVLTMPDYMLFDSLAVQEDGRVCVATLISGGLTIIDPETGKFEYHDLPDEPYVTNICFGGPEMRDAWITGSGRGTLHHAEWPTPGLKLEFYA